MDNRTIAQQLMHQARYLGDHQRSLYRARAYRRAAETVLGLDEPIESIVAQRGRRGLQELPGIGAHIARTLETLVHTGALPTLNKDSAALRDRSSASQQNCESDSCTPCAVSSK